MFSFFSKKTFLRDHLEGFVDIHNHILPGLDDGAPKLADSIALIKKYNDLGIREYISTPHIMNDFYPNTPARINAALEEVKRTLGSNDLGHVKIKAAAEYMMDQSFLDQFEKGQLLCLLDNYVLVEMSYFQAPINLKNILFQLQTHEYRPVLAHPERYVYFHSKGLDQYQDLKRRGCYFQLNMLSVTGHYGEQIKRMALRLLENDMIDYIGIDTHQIRHLDKLFEVRILQKEMDLLIPVIKRTKDLFRKTFY